MLKTLPQKEKDGQYSSERKDTKGKRKPKNSNTDVSKNFDTRHRSDVKSKRARQKRGQARKTEAQVSLERSLRHGPEKSAWNTERNAAEMLFANVESMANEQVTEEDDFNRAVSESLEMAMMEKCVIDAIPQDEAAAVSAEESEDECAWDKVQRNLPSPEPEEDCKTSGANNNAGMQRIENLTIPAVKLETRPCTISSREEDKKDHGHRSEILLRNEAAIGDALLVPAVGPKFIDKFGRIDGYTERRLFQGKGGRFKEQEYLKQQQLQQLESRNESKEAQGTGFQQSPWPSKKAANASEEARVSAQDSVQLPKQSPNASKEAHAFPQDAAQSTKQFMRASDETPSSSQCPARSQKQLKGVSEETLDSSRYPAQPENQFAVQDSSHLTNPFKSVSEELPVSSQSFARATDQSTYLPLKTPDYSHQGSGSRPRQVTNTPGQTSASSHQSSGPMGRPIVSGANFNNPQQKRYSTSGQSVNRGSYYDRNSVDRNCKKPTHESYSVHNRNSRSAQNFCETYDQPYRDGHRGSRDKRNFHKPSGESDRDFCSDARYEQNPNKYRGSRADLNSYKYDAEHNRDVYRGPRADQSSYRYDAEHNRDAKRAEENFSKFTEESSKNENNNDYQAARQDENLSHVFVEEFNIPAVAAIEVPPARSSDNSIEESQEKFEEAVIQRETKEFHEIASNIENTEVPHISNVKSRFTGTLPGLESPMEMISTPPVVVSPLNPFIVSQTPSHSVNSDTACPMKESQHPPSQPPGFQPLERPAKPFCANCAPLAPLEVRHPTLQRHDPLLYKLLLQNQERNPCSPTNCTNCDRDSQIPSNPTEVMNPNVECFESEEDCHAQFQMYPPQMHPPPMHPYYPVSDGMQCPEAANMLLHDNSEWNFENRGSPTNHFHEYPPFVVCSVDPVGNAYEFNYIMSHPYENVQHPMNMQPHGDEYPRYSPSGLENIPPDVQRQMQHSLLSRQYNVAPANCPILCDAHGEQIQPPIVNYVHDGQLRPMPFGRKHHGARNAMMSRRNFGHKHQLPLDSMEVYGNNPPCIAETYQSYPKTFTPIQGGGRGRRRPPHNSQRIQNN